MNANARASALLVAVLAAGCASASATEDAPRGVAAIEQQAHRDTGEDFHWSGRVPRGQTIEIIGVNGSIRASESADGMARVDAARRANRSDPASVEIEVVEHSGGVTICAVYPTPEGSRQRNRCRPGRHESNVQRNDVSVDFVVRVPAGVRLDANTVNGNIAAEGLDSRIDAATVNGNVRVRTTGAAEGRTVNGNVSARVGGRLTEDLRFQTVNGSVTLEIPSETSARVRASTVSGRVRSDFPVSGRTERRSLRGTIGEGGPQLRLSTVNGSIRLRRI